MARRSSWLLAQVSAVALVIGACGSSTGVATPSATSAPTTGAASPSSAAKPLRLALIVGLSGHPFYQAMACGALDAAAKVEPKANVNVQGPAAWDLSLQLPILEAVVQTKPDGIILVPVDPVGLIAPVKQITAGGIPIVTTDGDLSQPVELQNIKTDNLAAGQQAGKLMADLVGGKGTVLIVGFDPADTTTMARENGFRDAMKAFPDVKLLPTEYTGTDEVKAASVVETSLLSHPEITAIYSVVNFGGQGVVTALREASKTGKIKNVSFFADPKVQYKDLESGAYDGLVVQTPYTMGYQAVETLVGVLTGKLKASDVKYQATSETVVATPSNYKDPAIAVHLVSKEC